MENRIEESNRVKRALQKPGLADNIRVKHGTGTAWGWVIIKAYVPHAPDCNCRYDGITREIGTACHETWETHYQQIREIARVELGRARLEEDRIAIQLEHEQEVK